MRLLLTAVAATAIALLMILAVAGSNRFSGPVLIHFGDDHGIHVTDLLVATVGSAAIGAVAVLSHRR